MRLPRRVPWVTLLELDQLCGWIYADETDMAARQNAVNRLFAWRVITQLPHALEAVLSLLNSINLDESNSAGATPIAQHPQYIGDGQLYPKIAHANNITKLNVRQSYSIAIVRLVNGLVDPLQVGTYARSIAVIAAQIGLPQFLVELRHAATHEDLPGLELLRAAAKESLQWLFHNYFLPTLSTSNFGQSNSQLQLSPLNPLLKQYKSIMKSISRDLSLRTRYKDELSRCLRDLERWLGEAKVASASVIFNGWGTRETSEEGEENERWALERLCDALLDRGGLVPVSMRKRLASNLKSDPALQPRIVAIWAPLLSTLERNHPALSWVLVSAISEFLLFKPFSQSIDNPYSNKDLSYEYCLAAWAAWCVDHWEVSSSDSREGTMLLRRKDIVTNIVSALAIRSDEPLETKRGARALLHLLVQAHADLEEVSISLLSAAQQSMSLHSGESWTDDTLQTMERRLNDLLSSDSVGGARSTSLDMDVKQSITAQPLSEFGIQSDEIPKGWRRICLETWKPCPIGVYREPS